MASTRLFALLLAAEFLIPFNVRGQTAPASATSASAPAPITHRPSGEDLFASYGCGGCHTLAKAGSTGRAGPALDGNANLAEDFVIDRVTNGQGMMPAFTGQMTSEEIAALAKYVTEASEK